MVDANQGADCHSNADSGIALWMQQLPSWAKAMVAAMFMFTIWSVFTGFNLGEILNKVADAELEQRKMQFEAQLKLQEMQFQATEQSNDKLEVLINSVGELTGRLDNQSSQILAIIRRVTALEEGQAKTSNLQQAMLVWVCDHEKKSGQKPEYCEGV